MDLEEADGGMGVPSFGVAAAAATGVCGGKGEAIWTGCGVGVVCGIGRGGGIGVTTGIGVYWPGVAGRDGAGDWAGLCVGCLFFLGCFGTVGVPGADGGGIMPREGPYMMMGRLAGRTVAGLGSLTPYIVASNMCGSHVMRTWPSLTMDSLGGFFVSSFAAPFRLEGFVQYFSKMPSLIHLWRDRASDSGSTPLPC